MSSTMIASEGSLINSRQSEVIISAGTSTSRTLCGLRTAIFPMVSEAPVRCWIREAFFFKFLYTPAPTLPSPARPMRMGRGEDPVVIERAGGRKGA